MSDSVEKLGETQLLKDASKEITYKTIFLHKDPVLHRNVYVAHIIFHETLKLSNVSFAFRAFDLCFEELIKLEKNVNIDNSVLFTIYELQKGIRFIPDLRVFKKGELDQDQIEKEKLIKLGGIALIINSPHFNKYKRAIMQVSRFLSPKTNVAVVKTYDEALASIEEFKFKQ